MDQEQPKESLSLTQRLLACIYFGICIGLIALGIWFLWTLSQV